jgi:hypothetical protein
MYLSKEIIDDLQRGDNNLVQITDFTVFNFPKKDSMVYLACMCRHAETGIEYMQVMNMPRIRAQQMGNVLVSHAELVHNSGPSF